jgi:pimeloyl-ACP methyl ester carboxylesterase
MWAMELALKAPEKVKALVMMDTFVGAEPESTKALYFNMIEVIEKTGAVPEPMVDLIVPMFFSPATLRNDSEVPATFKARLMDMKDERIKTIVTLGRAIFGRPERLTALKDVTCPMMVMCGKDDVPRPIEEAQRMAKLAASRLGVIPDAGHICTVEKPDLVNQALMDFLTEVL